VAGQLYSLGPKMTSRVPISPSLRKELTRVYEEIMWLAQREEVTASFPQRLGAGGTG